MAIFSSKPEDKVDDIEAKKAVAADNSGGASEASDNLPVVVSRNGVLIVPRLSEKSVAMNKLNKYVFKVEGKINKIELRKAIERTYGATVIGVNMITVKSKARRYGRSSGRTSGFKKAIVTLSPNSKKIDTIQA